MVLSTLNYIHNLLKENVENHKRSLEAIREAEDEAFRRGAENYHELVQMRGKIEDSYFEAVGVLEEFEEQEW